MRWIIEGLTESKWGEKKWVQVEWTGDKQIAYGNLEYYSSEPRPAFRRYRLIEPNGRIHMTRLLQSKRAVSPYVADRDWSS